MKETNKTGRLKGIIYALISSGTFGLIPLFSIPLMTDAHMGVSTILFYRYFFSCIAVVILCYIYKVNLKINPKVGLKVFFLSLMYSLTALGLILSYNYLPSGMSTTIHFLYPMVVVFFMAIFFKEKISLKLIMAAIVAIAGVGFLSFGDGGSVSRKGLLLAFSTIFTYGAYITGLNMKGVKEIDPKAMTFHATLVATFLYGGISLSTGSIAPIPDIAAATNLIMLALFPTVVSILTLVLAVKYAGSTITSILGASEPMVATIIGITVFSERFTLYSFIGLTIIIAAVTYVVISTRKSV